MENKSEQTDSSNIKQKILWGVSGTIAVLVLGGIFLVGILFGMKNNISSAPPEKNMITKPVPEKIMSGINDSSLPSQASNLSKDSTEKQNSTENKKLAGWKTYSSESQGYSLSYPSDGKISQPDPNDFEEGLNPAKDSCLTLKLSGGYIVIYGKNNDPDLTGYCLGTGLGSEWHPVGKIDVEVFGKRYTVNGMGTSSASAGYRNEFYVVNTDGGERIKFGIEVNEKYAPEISYKQAKNKIISVLKNLERL